MIGLLDAGLRIIEKVIPDPDAQREARLKLLEMQQAGELAELQARAGIIQAEAQSEHVLTATWRPLVMIWFAALIGAHWFGFTPENLPPEQVAKLLDILEVAIGGYVIGRSVEKAAKHVRMQ